MGDADQHAVRCAQHLARLVEHDLDVAGVLAERVCELRRSWSRVDVGKRADPALGLGHDLVGDDEHVGVGYGGSARRCSMAVAIRAAEIVAGGDLRESLERGDAESLGAGGPLGAGSHQLVEHAPSMGGSAAAVGQLLLESLEIVGRVDVERQAGDLDHLRRHPGHAGVGHVAPAAVRTEARCEHVGWR